MTKPDFKNFAVIGGDKRQLYLANALETDGARALLAGFDRANVPPALPLCGIAEAVAACDAVILPLLSVRVDGSVNSPLAAESIYLDDDVCRTMAKKPVFAAGKARLVKSYPLLENAEIFDYGARNDFAVLNAVPTAEGALQCAMSEYDGTIFGSSCLVAGFGRIGKVLCRLLHGTGADVSAAARKPDDLAYIRALGYGALDFNGSVDLGKFDIVFNTVPHKIFDKQMLKSAHPGTIVIDLASLPGGVDFEAAAALDLRPVRALALPGKYSPKAAGEIIKNTIFKIIKEVYG